MCATRWRKPRLSASSPNKGRDLSIDASELLPATPAEPVVWQFADLREDLLDELLLIENTSYSNPWTRGNFLDAVKSEYRCQVLLWGEGAAARIAGYFIAMAGYEEAHLLNIAVAPCYRGQGVALVLLNQLCLWARSQNLDYLWLEVRRSNLRAQKLYKDYGMQQVGERKEYYPVEDGTREDALVLTYQLRQ